MVRFLSAIVVCVAFTSSAHAQFSPNPNDYSVQTTFVNASFPARLAKVPPPTPQTGKTAIWVQFWRDPAGIWHFRTYAILGMPNGPKNDGEWTADAATSAAWNGRTPFVLTRVGNDVQWDEKITITPNP